MRWLILVLMLTAGIARADLPVVQYLFPAGGQRGTNVTFHVGGLNLHQSCQFELSGTGVIASPKLERAQTLYLEGPMMYQPESQRQEDYPQDMRGSIAIAPDAALGVRWGRVWTSQGVAATPAFVIGDLPEIIEKEQLGDTPPVPVTTPLTINGRIFPREDRDTWSFAGKAGETWLIRAEAGRFGSPLMPQIEVRDEQNRRIGESIDRGLEDVELRLGIPRDGRYTVTIRDVGYSGGPAHVYRLTIRPAPIATTPPVQNSIAAAKPLPADGASGCVDQPGDVDFWKIEGKKGEPITLELTRDARTSTLIPLITLHDAKNELLTSFDATGNCTPKEDGPIYVQVADRFARRGGATLTYTLNRVERNADFSLTASLGELSVVRKGDAKLRVMVQRQGGFNGAIVLGFTGLPAGLTLAAPAILQPNQNQIDITLKADEKAPIRCDRVTLHGTGWLPLHPLTSLQRPIHRVATVVPTGADHLRIAVGLPTPFKIVGEYSLKLVPRGTIYQRKYRIERGGYDGPIVVAMADHQSRYLQGAHGPTITVAAGVSEFSYPTTLPSWMETGRTARICIMGTATVRDFDGTAHQVNYSSVQQNDQIIAVVEPGRISIESERTSLALEPGKVIEIPVRMRRGTDLKGPARVELLLPEGCVGLSAEPLTIAADQERGILRVKMSEQPRGVVNVPLILRASIDENGSPVFAETKIELVMP